MSGRRAAEGGNTQSCRRGGVMERARRLREGESSSSGSTPVTIGGPRGEL